MSRLSRMFYIFAEVIVSLLLCIVFLPLQISKLLLGKLLENKAPILR